MTGLLLSATRRLLNGFPPESSEVYSVIIIGSPGVSSSEARVSWTKRYCSF